MKKIIVISLFAFTGLLFSQCTGQQETQNEQSAKEQEYLSRGQEFALATKATLGKNLMAAIHSDGPAYAVEFCNTRAIPLTDSMATAQGVSIRRVSDQPRNPDNAANADELNYIRTAKALLANGEQIKGKIQNRNGKMIGYYPIVTNDMCLKCHGDPEQDINEATLTKIQSLYPADQATGYSPNELRGIWVVEMEKDSRH